MGKGDGRFAEAIPRELAEECEAAMAAAGDDRDAWSAAAARVINAFMQSYYFPEWERRKPGVRDDADYLRTEAEILGPLHKAWRTAFPGCHGACMAWLRHQVAEKIMGGLPALQRRQMEMLYEVPADEKGGA